MATNHFLKVHNNQASLDRAIHVTNVQGLLSRNLDNTAIQNLLLPSFIPTPSDREIEVLSLLAEGMTTLEIAEKLFISRHTVNAHRANLMKKLRVKNTAKLISMGFRLKYLR